MAWLRIVLITFVALMLGACQQGNESPSAVASNEMTTAPVQQSFVQYPPIQQPLPALSFQPEVLDMGSVLEGEKAEAELLLRNGSDKSIFITKVEASCGCTAAEPESRVLEPGGFTRMKVSIDTSAKLEMVNKSIRVEGSGGEVATAILHLTVRPNPHAEKMKLKGIFDGECASCHFTPAKGKTSGADIYAAVCAMCHGAKAEGGYAPKLRGFPDADVLLSLIQNGTGSRHMPGFSTKEGGPLDESQIRALQGWLLSLD